MMHDFGPGEDFRGVWVNGGSKLGKRGMKGEKAKLAWRTQCHPSLPMTVTLQDAVWALRCSQICVGLNVLQ